MIAPSFETSSSSPRYFPIRGTASPADRFPWDTCPIMLGSLNPWLGPVKNTVCYRRLRSWSHLVFVPLKAMLPSRGYMDWIAWLLLVSSIHHYYCKRITRPGCSLKMSDSSCTCRLLYNKQDDLFCYWNACIRFNNYSLPIIYIKSCCC